MSAKRLRDELDGNPTLYGAMSDQQVADELNAITKSSKAPISGMFLYLLNNNNRTNQGADTNVTSILGRLRQVAESAVGDDPFGAGLTPTNYSVTLKGKHAAQSFLDLLISPHVLDLDFEDANLPYGQCVQMGIWKSADVAALSALSMNQASRAQQLGLGTVYPSQVTFARSL